MGAPTRFDMGADGGSPDSDSSTENEHQEECRRAAAERAKLRKQGLTTKKKVRKSLELRLLIHAKERAPSTPTPPNGSRKASPPDSVLFPP